MRCSWNDRGPPRKTPQPHLAFLAPRYLGLPSGIHTSGPVRSSPPWWRSPQSVVWEAALCANDPLELCRGRRSLRCPMEVHAQFDGARKLGRIRRGRRAWPQTLCGQAHRTEAEPVFTFEVPAELNVPDAAATVVRSRHDRAPKSYDVASWAVCTSRAHRPSVSRYPSVGCARDRNLPWHGTCPRRPNRSSVDVSKRLRTQSCLGHAARPPV